MKLGPILKFKLNTHTHTHTHTHARTHIHTHTFPLTHTHPHIQTHTHTHTRTYTHIHTHLKNCKISSFHIKFAATSFGQLDRVFSKLHIFMNYIIDVYFVYTIFSCSVEKQEYTRT